MSQAEALPLPLVYVKVTFNVLSPRLFLLYVDDFIGALRKSGVGCHIVDMLIAAIMYADDLALLAPTRSSLQKLLKFEYLLCIWSSTEYFMQSC